MISFEEFYNSVWYKVPEVWRNADAESGKALQLLVYTMSQHMYHYFYKKIDSLPELFDPELCPAKYLKFLASLLGWNLVGTDEYSWREQIKTAPLLYKIKGTRRSITIAERLVGYSVFFSELYRDHLGELVPKEKIFNATPTNIKDMPWFRSVSIDENNQPIQGDIVSDLFESFNDSDAFLNEYGEVVRPYLSSTDRIIRTTSKLSTTSDYDNVTGSNSLARYAKTPRVNVVLRKIEPLDSIDQKTGSLQQNNLAGALDLLMQFKPFNIYINNIEVLFDVSDYIAGSEEASSAEQLWQNETCDFSVYIKTEPSGESILYGLTTDTIVEPAIDYSPSLLTTYKILSDFSSSPAITDFNDLQFFGMTARTGIIYQGIQYGYSILNNRVLSLSDFDLTNPINKPKGIDYIDIATKSIWLLDLPIRPAFSFRSIDISSIDRTGLHSFENLYSGTSDILGISTRRILTDIQVIKNSDRRGLYSHSLELTFKTDHIDAPNETYVNRIDNCTLNNFAHLNLELNVGSNIQTELIEFFCRQAPIAVIASYGINSAILPTSMYTIYGNRLIIDTLQITKLLNINTITEDTFLSSGKLAICSLVTPTSAEQFSSTNPTRGNYIPQRSHTKFTRQYGIESSQSISAEHIKSVESYTKNDDGSLYLNQNTTKVFKTELARVFTRGSLASTIVNSQTPVVSKNILAVADRTQWKVYSKLYSNYYSGVEKVSSFWWTDFYQTTPVDSSYLIDYNSVDKSPEAQLINRTSPRWQAAKKILDPSNPDHFLATRKSSPGRASIWTRGSARKMSYPYDGTSRSKLQRNRGDITLFNRSDNGSDYTTSTIAISRISNHKYALSNGIDITKSYFNPTFSLAIPAHPEIEYIEINKLRIDPEVPSRVYTTLYNTSQYETPMQYANRLTYYSNASNGSLHTSLYAGNIVSSSTTLLSEATDFFDLQVDGLINIMEEFIPTVGQTAFILKYPNIYINWYEKYSGSYINAGYFPFDRFDRAIPDIQVYLNGILVPYKDAWNIIFDSQPSLVFTRLTETDRIKVYYNVLNTNLRPTSPAIDLTPQTIKNTIAQPFNLYSGELYSVTLPNTVSISWYDSISGEYLTTNINSSEATPGINYETAYPDISVYINGLIIKYLTDWTFRVNILGSIDVVLNEAISYKLTTSDTVEIGIHTT